jgi:hypothetical protein
MGDLRLRLIKHLDTLRAGIIALHKVDSGLYNVDQVDALLRQPNALHRIESDWVHNLTKILHIIQEFLTIVERWAGHVYGLAHNLGATPQEASQIRDRQISGVRVLQTKAIDKDYLSGVLAASTHEVDRLIDDTQALLLKGQTMVELIKQYGGPFFGQVAEISLAWVAVDRRDFYAPLQTLLEASRVATATSQMVEPLGRYLDQVASIIASTPMFVGQSTTLTFSDTDLQASRQGIQHLVSATEHLESYIEKHYIALHQLQNHQTILLRAVLPSTTPIQQWIIRHITERTTPTETLLPTTLTAEKLHSVFQAAENNLTDADDAVVKAKSHLTHALPLNAILQSPAIEKYLQAAQLRLALYDEWRPRINQTFAATCLDAKS